MSPMTVPVWHVTAEIHSVRPTFAPQLYEDMMGVHSQRLATDYSAPLTYVHFSSEPSSANCSHSTTHLDYLDWVAGSKRAARFRLLDWVRDACGCSHDDHQNCTDTVTAHLEITDQTATQLDEEDM